MILPLKKLYGASSESLSRACKYKKAAVSVPMMSKLYVWNEFVDTDIIYLQTILHKTDSIANS